MEDTILPSDLTDSENDNGFSTPLLTFAAVMTFLIMIVGIFGNFLTVVALVKCPKVRNVAAAFIISLCIADLLFCLLVLPFSGMRFINGAWTHVEALCKLIPFIQYGNIGVSLLCIAMITINRYVMIAHHSSYSKIYKNHWIAAMIAFCWLFSYGMQLPTLFGVWGKFDYDPKLETCSIMSDDHGRTSKTALFIIAFLIPCLIIVACYTKIFWVVHESEMRMKNHAKIQNSYPNNLRASVATNSANGQLPLSPNAASESSFSSELKLDTVAKPARLKDQREVRTKRNEWRITKMVLAIFLSFVICYLPITIVKVSDKEVEYPELHVISYLLLYLSACINPIIYVIMNKQYRKAYKTVIFCEPSKILSFGKALGGSSAAEKWKDIGLSNNHSRTMVSQMDQVNSSSSQPKTPPIALELKSKSIVRKPQVQEMVTLENPSGQTITPSPDSPLPCQDKVTTSTPTPMKPLHKTPHFITLVDGDIILEEEEVEATIDLPEVNQLDQEIPHSSLEPPRKTQFYGQNINVIQDNHDKVQTKLKL